MTYAGSARPAAFGCRPETFLPTVRGELIHDFINRERQHMEMEERIFFPTALKALRPDAVTCAIEVQKQVRERNAGSPEDSRIQFRIGINVGDIIVDGDDIYGDGVNVAARIQALADPGGIYISRGAADQVRDKVPIKIETRGEQTVKNIARPIEVFCIIAEDRDGIAATVHESETRVQTPMVGDKPTIAVLPFVNMSGEPEQEFFADGITEDILTELSRFRELFVISRNSAFVYKGKPINAQKVAKELGVQYVVEGSVRKAGSRVRITVQLIDAETDRHLWAERYDRELADIFAIQDEVTSSIVSILPGRVAAAAQDRVQRKPPENLAAYECVLAGKLLHHRSTRADNEEALRMLERAIALDPGYAHAHAWKACVLGQSFVNGWCADVEATTRAVIGGTDAGAVTRRERQRRAPRSRRRELGGAPRPRQGALPPGAGAGAQSKRRPHRRAAGRGADLDRPGRTRHRMDPEGDAPQPLSSRALLESSRPRLFRRAALRRGGQSVPTD